MHMWDPEVHSFAYYVFTQQYRTRISDNTILQNITHNVGRNCYSADWLGKH